MASMRPAPAVDGVTRWIWTSAWAGTVSTQVGIVALICSSDPPSDASGSNGEPARPKRVTRLAPAPPARGLEWQVEQLLSLKMGPRPSATVRMWVNSVLPASNSARSAADRPGSGSPMRGWTSCAEAAPSASTMTMPTAGIRIIHTS
jgi:hypothetical protein